MMPGKHTHNPDDPLALTLTSPVDESPDDRVAHEVTKQEALCNAIDESLKAKHIADKKKCMIKLLLLS